MTRKERRAAAEAAVAKVMGEVTGAARTEALAKGVAESRRRSKLELAVAAGRAAGSIVAKAEGSTNRFAKERREETKRWKKRKPFDVIRANRVVDPLFDLARRMSLDDRQRMAAISFRDAYEDVGGTIKSALDPDKVGGGGSFGPSANALAGADRLDQARRLLGQLQFDAVEMLIGRGMNLPKVTLILQDVADDRRRVSEARGRTSWLVKDGLRRLADIWWPPNRRNRIHARIEPGGRPVAGGDFRQEVERGKVVHASRHQTTGDRGRGES